MNINTIINIFRHKYPKPNSWSIIKRHQRWNRLLHRLMHHIEAYTDYTNISELKISEMFYIIDNDMKSRPTCLICMGYVKFFHNPESSNKIGYRTTCCTSCSNKLDVENKHTARYGHYKKPNKSYIDKFRHYRKVVNRITEINYQIHKNTIDPTDMRSKLYHLDHRYSVKQAFLDNIPAHIIGSQHNLEILLRTDNCSKNQKCSISKEELFEIFFQSQ